MRGFRTQTYLARLAVMLAGLAIGAQHLTSYANEERSFAVLIGPAVERNTTEKVTSYGSSVAFEFPVIDDQLEIAIGAQYLTTPSPKSVGLQAIFKKPFHIAPGVELGLGLGPAVWRKTSSPDNELHTGISMAADFMFWTTKTVGWYVSPGYTREFGRNPEKAFGISAGLLLGF